MVRKQKKGPKGIPDNLRGLAERGERYRWHGFWLGESKQDRMIAQWLDEVPNSAAAVKFLIYAYITGQGVNFTLASVDYESDALNVGEGAQALLGLDD
jgi:protein gp37